MLRELYLAEGDLEISFLGMLLLKVLYLDEGDVEISFIGVLLLRVMIIISTVKFYEPNGFVKFLFSFIFVMFIMYMFF